MKLEFSRNFFLKIFNIAARISVLKSVFFENFSIKTKPQLNTTCGIFRHLSTQPSKLKAADLVNKLNTTLRKSAPQNSIFNKMPKIKPKKKLRSIVRYGGKQSELPVAELPTNRQIIQYYYHLKDQDLEAKPIYDYAKLITEKLVALWRRVNPRLGLIARIDNKVKILLDVAYKANFKYKCTKKKTVTENLDRLFDISSCSCDLPTVPCDDTRVKCQRCVLNEMNSKMVLVKTYLLKIINFLKTSTPPPPLCNLNISTH